MCGIVGYFGKERAAEILVDGLEKLEYRGYDSAGIAVFQNGDIDVITGMVIIDPMLELLEHHDPMPVGEVADGFTGKGL